MSNCKSSWLVSVQMGVNTTGEYSGFCYYTGLRETMGEESELKIRNRFYVVWASDGLLCPFILISVCLKWPDIPLLLSFFYDSTTLVFLPHSLIFLYRPPS